jgi:hypothetical protein
MSLQLVPKIEANSLSGTRRRLERLCPLLTIFTGRRRCKIRRVGQFGYIEVIVRIDLATEARVLKYDAFQIGICRVL